MLKNCIDMRRSSSCDELSEVEGFSDEFAMACVMPSDTHEDASCIGRSWGSGVKVPPTVVQYAAQVDAK